MKNHIITVILILYFILYFYIDNKKNFLKITIGLLAFLAVSKFNSAKEHMDIDLYNKQQLQCSKPSLPRDFQFNKFYVNESNLLNFKCKYQGKEYYLACVKTSECINDKAKPIDCSQYSIILMDESDAHDLLEKYIDDIHTQVNVCNFTEQQKCQVKNKKLISDEESQVCASTFPECRQEKQFITDFNVETYEQKDGSLQYNFIGTAEPYLNNKILKTSLNQILVNTQGVDLICGDFGKSNDENTNVLIYEKNINSNKPNIIGNDDGLVNVHIAFKTHLINSTVDPNTGARDISPLKNIKGDSIILIHYLSWTPETCKYKGKTYNRLGLHSNVDDPNVLSFTPKIVKKTF